MRIAVALALIGLASLANGQPRAGTALMAIDVLWSAEPLGWWDRIWTSRTKMTCPEPGFCYARDADLHCSSGAAGVPECFHEIEACSFVDIVEQTESLTRLRRMDGREIILRRDLRDRTIFLGDVRAEYPAARARCMKERHGAVMAGLPWD